MDKINVLIAEDNQTVAREIAQSVEAYGHSVTTIVNNGYDAITKVVGPNPPDLLLLDIGLNGDQDGIQVAHSINDLNPIPFIYLTADSSTEVLERAKLTHPHGYLVKPIDENSLKATIEMAMYNFNYQKITEPIQKSSTVSYLLKDRIFVKNGDAFQRVLLGELLFIIAEGHNVIMHTEENAINVKLSIKDCAKKIETHNSYIMRVNRSYMVNLREVDSYAGNILYVKKKSIQVSAQYRKVVFDRLRGL